MKRVTKAVAALLAVIMVGGSFSGCSSKNNTSSGSSSGSQKEVTITWPCIWVGTDTKATATNSLVTQFNAENAGKIKVVVNQETDYQAYRDKITTEMSAGSMPDFFTFDTNPDKIMGSGKLLDLTSELKKDNWQDDFMTGSLKQVTVKGKITAVPWELGAVTIFYNKKLLAKAGWDHFPTTYDDLWKCCDALKAAGITPFSQMTGENAWTSMLWYSEAAVAIGGQNVWNNPKDPAFAKAADVVKKMFTYTTADAVGAGAAVSGGHFLANQTAIYINGPWYIPNFKKKGTDNLADNVAIADAPTYAGGKGKAGGYIGYVQTYMAVAKTTPEKQAAALKFLKYMTKPSNVAVICQSSGALSYVKIPSASLTDKLQSQIETLVSKAPYLSGQFQSVNTTAVSNEFPQAISALVLGKYNSQQFVDDINSKR